MVGIMVAEKYQKEVKSSLVDYAREALRYECKRKEQICIDLQIPSSLRLTEVERYRIMKLFERIAIAAENEIRLHLIALLEDFAPMSLIMILNDPTKHLTLNWLPESALLRDPHFVEILIRRVREYFLQKNALEMQNASLKEPDALDDLISQSISDVALPAMALLIAENRRLDHFEDPVLSRTDLPTELQYKLLWWVAACLRPFLLESQIQDDRVDEALSFAVRQVLAHYDEGDTLEARALKLAHNLHKYKKLSDDFILQSALGGHIVLVVAALAIRSSVSHHLLWNIVLDGDGSPLLLLLKAIGMERQTSIALTIQVTEHSLDEHLLTERINAFDSLSELEADKALALWRLDECYREAIYEIDIQYNKVREKRLRAASPDFFQQDCL
ncbi:uncharacterized protein DUF2336 [Zymomonas mobilis]|uniref:Uncharacterized protein DUF2336 n=2 Tax=Zymomonas mobilis TaxID=542 RepID=A0A542VYY9_ZYMMB|nr:uncharacterized protein DUF2336 [Zymomonas mobilis]